MAAAKVDVGFLKREESSAVKLTMAIKLNKPLNTTSTVASPMFIGQKDIAVKTICSDVFNESTPNIVSVIARYSEIQIMKTPSERIYDANSFAIPNFVRPRFVQRKISSAPL